MHVAVSGGCSSKGREEVRLSSFEVYTQSCRFFGFQVALFEITLETVHNSLRQDAHTRKSANLKLFAPLLKFKPLEPLNNAIPNCKSNSKFLARYSRTVNKGTNLMKVRL